METALTVAGSDPTAGAGIQADLRVFHALGVHGMAVIAALTSQNTLKVTDVFPLREGQVSSQLSALLDDIRPAALKTGMLYSTHAVNAVADAMEAYKLKNLVLDPLSISSSGKRLLTEDAFEAMKQRLIPLARVVTPNLEEAAALSGINDIRDIEKMKKAASAIREMGPEVVIVTGGHLEGSTLELIYDGKEFNVLEGHKYKGDYHGTGCAYSACITALLARGMKDPLEAARMTRGLMDNAIKDAFRPGGGMGILRF